jgi:hypothetical protein
MTLLELNLSHKVSLSGEDVAQLSNCTIPECSQHSNHDLVNGETRTKSRTLFVPILTGISGQGQERTAAYLDGSKASKARLTPFDLLA